MKHIQLDKFNQSTSLKWVDRIAQLMDAKFWNSIEIVDSFWCIPKSLELLTTAHRTKSVEIIMLFFIL